MIVKQIWTAFYFVISHNLIFNIFLVDEKNLLFIVIDVIKISNCFMFSDGLPMVSDS